MKLSMTFKSIIANTNSPASKKEGSNPLPHLALFDRI